jgi:hypothetical protein
MVSLFLTYAAAVCAAVALWLARGALAVQSAAPGAPRVGILPPWWELALFVLAAASAVFLLRPSRATVTPLFATLLMIAPWAPGVTAPWLLVWTGPLAAAVLLAAALATVWPWLARQASRVVRGTLVQRPPLLTACLAFLLFGIVAFGARAMVPTGDEPHYLVITQSLLYDGDIKIENNHARRDSASYFPGPLRPDYFVRGRNGAIYSVHAPGLSVLIAPAFLAGGYIATVVFLIVIASVGVGLAWHVAYELTGRAGAASYAAAAVTMATPIAFHTFAVYPDGPGGVLVLTGAWALFRRELSPRALVWHGVALAALPWLHTRFAVLAGLIGVFILLRLPRTSEGLRRAAAFLAVPMVSGLAWFAYFWVIYGTPNPEAPYGDFMASQASWSFVTGGIAGVLFDQQFGSMLYAPVFAIAFAGWVVMLRHRRTLAVELAVLAIPYLVATTHLRMWWGGSSAPARFQVPILWLGAIGAAMAWAAARSRAARASALAALGVSAFSTLALAFVDGGRRAYNSRDGYSLWLDWLSPLGDLPLGLPSFFRWHGQEWVLHLQILFMLAFFAAAFLAVRIVDRLVRPATGTLGLFLLVAYAAAGMGTLRLLWWPNDSTGLRPAISQIDLLRAAADERRIGLAYSARFPHRVSPDAAVQTMRVESPVRMLVGDEPPALVLPGWIPAGTYELQLNVRGSAPAPYEVRVMRTDRPVLTGDARIQASPVLTVPADLPAIIVRGSGLAASSLRPRHIFTRREKGGERRARSARRYGDTVVWYLDGNAFNEPQGFWVRGAADSTVILQPDQRRRPAVRVLVRNGAVPNHVTLALEDGSWREPLELAPGSEREIEVPVSPKLGCAALRVASRDGFRPSEVDRGSADSRFLGVWIEPR